MYLKRFYDEKLAHASYLVGCQAKGEAIVIDAARDVSPYLEEAKAQGFRITAVTETHIHADYLSGSRQLAEQTGAKMYLSNEGDQDWKYQFARAQDQLVGDGDVITLGNLTFKVLATPGHTPEHISFLLTDHPASDEPIGLFSGDFLFVGDVGRPDLLEKAAGHKDTMRPAAVALFKSIQKARELPDHIQIWPAHGAGSACGKALGAIPSSVLGYEKITNWAFQITDEDRFVEAILDGQPEAPKYFAQMKKLNKLGPPLLSGDFPRRLDSKTLEKIQAASTLIDLRGEEPFVTSHPKGALFLPSGGSLVTWAGWLLSYEEDFYLLLCQEPDVQEAVRALRSIGLDRIAGYFLQEDFEFSKVEREGSVRIEAQDVVEEKQFVLDVRSTKEWNAGHLEGAKHLHLGYVADHINDIPEAPVVHCRSGVRSLIASSLLQRAGKRPVDVLGGYEALKMRKEVVPT